MAALTCLQQAAFFPFSILASILMFHWESEVCIAPVTCVYAYAAVLGGRLITIVSWPTPFSDLLVLGKRPRCWALASNLFASCFSFG
jgi:hypothetical protein